MKKEIKTKKTNSYYHSVIKNQKSLEIFFKSKYNIPILTYKEYNECEKIRDQKIPNYESKKLMEKLGYIIDTNLTIAIKEEIKEMNYLHSKGGIDAPISKKDFLKDIDELVNIIILKEIQKENIQKYEKKTTIYNFKEKLFQRQKDNRQINSNKNDEFNQELEDMCIYGNIIKKELKEEKQKNPNKFIEIKEALKSGKKDKDKEIFALGLLGYNLQEKGIEVAIEKSETKEEEELDANTTSLQFMLNSMSDKKKYELHFDFGEKKNEEYLNNEDKFNELKEQLK